MRRVFETVFVDGLEIEEMRLKGSGLGLEKLTEGKGLAR
jgi:hypothetical protein